MSRRFRYPDGEVRLSGALFSRAGARMTAQHLRDALDLAATIVEGEAVKRAPANLGHLRQSISHKVSIEGGKGDKPPKRVVAQIGTPLEYGRWMEVGTKHGKRMPPPNVLEPWVRRKLGVADPRKVRSLAFVIARAIGRRGLAPRRYLAQAVAKTRREVRRTIESLAAKWAREMNGG